VDLDLVAGLIRRMISSGIELHEYQNGHGQAPGPTGAITLFVSDARSLASTLGNSYDDWPTLLRRLGIDPGPAT
jgi:hypothetical protein